MISPSKDVAIYWLRDNAGYSNEEMPNFILREFPLDEKVFVKDLGETSVREMIDEVVQTEIFVVFQSCFLEKS